MLWCQCESSSSKILVLYKSHIYIYIRFNMRHFNWSKVGNYLWRDGACLDEKDDIKYRITRKATIRVPIFIHRRANGPVPLKVIKDTPTNFGGITKAELINIGPRDTSVQQQRRRREAGADLHRGFCSQPISLASEKLQNDLQYHVQLGNNV